MTLPEDQIKHMVDRFLGWKLPGNFNPDGGVSFKKTFNESTAHPMKHEPSGTNLFDANQVDGMVRHMIEEMPLNPDFRWLIEAPGARYLAVQRNAFEWTVDINKALSFRSKEQADALMMAVRQMDREMDQHRRNSFVALFGFEGTLGNAGAVERDLM
jgi:hypothetical protein